MLSIKIGKKIIKNPTENTIATFFGIVPLVEPIIKGRNTRGTMIISKGIKKKLHLLWNCSIFLLLTGFMDTIFLLVIHGKEFYKPNAAPLSSKIKISLCFLNAEAGQLVEILFFSMQFTALAFCFPAAMRRIFFDDRIVAIPIANA